MPIHNSDFSILPFEKKYYIETGIGPGRLGTQGAGMPDPAPLPPSLRDRYRRGCKYKLKKPHTKRPGSLSVQVRAISLS
jgi:hypothetical protein